MRPWILLVLSAGLAAAGCGSGTSKAHGDGGHDSGADSSLDVGDVGDAGDVGDVGQLDASPDADAPASEVSNSDAGRSDASGDAGLDGVAAGAACLGNVTLDFAALAPYWLDASTTCGTATTSGNVLTMTRSGACATDQQGGFVTLDTNRWKLCGDFDLRVDFTLSQFDTPTGGSRWQVVRAFDATSPDGIALERYDVALSGCYPSTLTYKSWTTSPVDCTGAMFTATTDVTGTMRVTRVGSTVTSYTTVTSDGGADGVAWSSFVTGTGMTTTPWSIELYTGAVNATTDQRVTFSNMVIKSSATP